MKITYNWLKEFIETGLTPEELHKKFFTLGIGVLISMFSAITVSRTLLRLVSGWEPLRSELLYLPGLNRSKPREDGSNRTEKK